MFGSAKIDSVSFETIGTGKMGDNARFNLTLSNALRETPTTLVGKFPADDEMARTLAGAQGAYYTEVMFYKELAHLTTMRTPAIYFNEIDDNRLDYITLMEDLAPASPGSQLVGESREHCSLALKEAAKLAANFYDDPHIPKLEYVMTQARDDGGALGGEYLKQCWPTFKERFADKVSTECLSFAERYVERHCHFVTRFKGPKTLVHGDFRSENIMFTPNEACVVDWQCIAESSPLSDLAYFMGGSVNTDDRRAWEREVVAEFNEHLRANGILLSENDCWDQYREQAMHGLMITILGASFSEPSERSDAMFLIMIQRHLQHCVDLDAGVFLS